MTLNFFLVFLELWRNILTQNVKADSLYIFFIRFFSSPKQLIPHLMWITSPQDSHWSISKKKRCPLEMSISMNEIPRVPLSFKKPFRVSLTWTRLPINSGGVAIYIRTHPLPSSPWPVYTLGIVPRLLFSGSSQGLFLERGPTEWDEENHSFISIYLWKIFVQWWILYRKLRCGKIRSIHNREMKFSKYFWKIFTLNTVFSHSIQ